MTQQKIQTQAAVTTFSKIFLVTVATFFLMSVIAVSAAGIIIQKRRHLSDQTQQRTQELRALPAFGNVSAWVFDTPGINNVEDIESVPRKKYPLSYADVFYAPDPTADRIRCATTNAIENIGSFETCGSGWYTHTLSGPAVNVVSLSNDEHFQERLSELTEQYDIVPSGALHAVLEPLPNEITELLKNNFRMFQETGYNLADHTWDKPVGSVDFQAVNVFYHINFMKSYLDSLQDEIIRLGGTLPNDYATDPTYAVIVPYAVGQLLCGVGSVACVAYDGTYYIIYPRSIAGNRETIYHEYAHEQHLPVFEDHTPQERLLYLYPYTEGVAQYMAATISDDPIAFNALCLNDLEACRDMTDEGIILGDMVSAALESGSDLEPHLFGLVLDGSLWALREHPEVGKQVVDTLFLQSWTMLRYGWERQGGRNSQDATYLDYLNIRDSLIGADRLLYPDTDNPAIGKHEAHIRATFAEHGVSEDQAFIYPGNVRKINNLLKVTLYSNAVDNCLFTMADRDTGSPAVSDYYCSVKEISFPGGTLPYQGERYVDIAYNDDERGIHLGGECHFVWDGAAESPEEKNSGSCRWFH